MVVQGHLEGLWGWFWASGSHYRGEVDGAARSMARSMEKLTERSTEILVLDFCAQPPVENMLR